MSSFKELLAADVQNVFINTEEFAELHTVTTFDSNGVRTDRKLEMTIERFNLEGNPFQYSEGVSVNNLVVYIEERILGYTPRVDQDFYLDLMKYKITGVSFDFGMLIITLKANGGRP